VQLLNAVLAKFVTCNEIKDKSSNLIGAWALQDLALYLIPFQCW
jgi:hypothetical protein